MSDWKYVSKLVVRRTGFPFQLLDRLMFEDSVVQADQQLEVEEQLQQEVDVLLKTHFHEQVKRVHDSGEREGLKRLSKLRNKTAKGNIGSSDLATVQTLWPGTPFAAQFAKVVALVEAVQKLRQAGEQVFADELARKRKTLQELVQDPFFAEAVFISNPDVYENSYLKYVKHNEFKKRPTQLKMLEKRFMSYLQRFAAKNDTASFFGPMNYARFDWEQAEKIKLDMTNGKYVQRGVFYSFWMTNVLADVISREPSIRPYVAPRLHPLCERTEHGVEYLFLNERRKVPAHYLTLLDEADGTTTLLELAERRDMSVDDLYKQVQVLVKNRLLLFGIEIPSTIFGPFDYLHSFVKSLPDHVEAKAKWVTELERFEQLRSEFEAASLEMRVQKSKAMEALFSELTQHATRRLAGKTYADRTLYYEECKGTIRDFSFNRAFFDEFEERIQPVMNLFAAYGEMMRGYYQRIAKRVFTEIAQDQSELSYAQFIRLVQELEEQGEVNYADEEFEAFHTKLYDLVRNKQQGNLVSLTQEDFAEFAHYDKGDSMHTSPDLMFAAKDLNALVNGDYQIVLGEVHQFISMWGSQFLFDSNRAEVEQEIEELLKELPAYHNLATILNTRRHKGLLYEAFPGTLIQFLGKPSDRAKHVVPLRDLVVRIEGDELMLVDKKSEQSFHIYNSGDENLHLWAFAVPRVATVPIYFEKHTPRIEINGVVYQRERWELPTEEFITLGQEDSEYDIFLNMRRAKRRHDLPRWTFVRVAKEKKPYYFDFDNYFLMELLYGHLKNNDKLILAEMHPDPEHLWLRDEDGSYCIELRGTAFRPPLAGSEEALAQAREVELNV